MDEGFATVGTDDFLEGYRRACARFRDAAGAGPDPPPAELFIPLFEALGWAGVLVDRLKIEAPMGLGLRFVRNQVHHQWADAVEMRRVPNPQVVQASGRGSRVVWPPVGYDWYWRPVSRLPPPDPRHPNVHLREAYEAHLAERRAREALDELEEMLAA